MRCPRCDAFVSVGQTVCDRCFTSLHDEERPRPVSPPREPPATDGNAALALAPEPVPAPEHPCPKHPELPVAGTCARCGAFVCARCAPALVEGGEVRCERCGAREAVPSSAGPEGIGGWLLVPALQLLLTFAVGVFSLTMVGVALAGGHSRVVAEGLDAQVLLQLASTVATLPVAVSFFRRRRAAPLFMVAWYVGQVALGLAGEGLPRGTLSALLWIPYFLSSQRVRRTFTR